ncbi:hypothetical protein C8F01DRAFT_976988 [Mycena amicta]|nr:hypothetical protein C8F01DRAFT_976988 [Mycena amicta]
MQLGTFLTSSPARLASYISRLQHRDRVLLFALSPNLPQEDLAKLVRQLTKFSPQTIGCLSAPLPHRNLLSCSFALFDPKTCTPFRSQIPGREAPQVGRYHSFRRRGALQRDSFGQDGPPPEGVDWDSVWDKSVTVTEPPVALHGLSPDDVGTIVYLTDGAPEGLSNSLSRFTRANKLGLFAASTPFITGRPVTLFINDEICDSGAVGLALSRPQAKCELRFAGLVPLAEPMTVSQSEGNLVVTLSNKNPTQLLLAAIRQEKINLDTPDYEEFCLATLVDDEVGFIPDQMFSILSGDPSRGTIALRSLSSPPPGSRVQVNHALCPCGISKLIP